MANPNSAWTRLRLQLAGWLDPCPDRGEAWCMTCALNGGRTLILNAAGHREHAEQHRNSDGDHTIAMRVNYGYIPNTEDT